jgi:2-amino-4-hydroxy-6-hydroxymethyldihydropteridine diphosphokinase
MTNLAYLSLGSNIQPEKNLQEAVRLLSQAGRICAVSTVWETVPVGFVDQPNFLNAALLLETESSAEELRSMVLRPIEQALHRVRTENPNAPRTIDIDLTLFNDEVFILGTRQVPDPDILTQAFVAIPLAEIAPNYVHPQNHHSLAEIAVQFAPEKKLMIRREDVVLQKLIAG